MSKEIPKVEDQSLSLMQILDNTDSFSWDGVKRNSIKAIEEDIRELTKRLRKTKDCGKVTIGIEFNQGADSEVITITDIKTKMPKAKMLPAVLHMDGKGNLYSEDPNQLKLDLNNIRSINAPEPPKVEKQEA